MTPFRNRITPATRRMGECSATTTFRSVSFPERITPATKHMGEDMWLRNYAERTIDAYTYTVDHFAKHFGKQPEDLGPEQIREFQVWMIQEKQSSWSSFNQAFCGPRFLYSITLPICV